VMQRWIYSIITSVFNHSNMLIMLNVQRNSIYLK